MQLRYCALLRYNKLSSDGALLHRRPTVLDVLLQVLRNSRMKPQFDFSSEMFLV